MHNIVSWYVVHDTSGCSHSSCEQVARDLVYLGPCDLCSYHWDFLITVVIFACRFLVCLCFLHLFVTRVQLLCSSGILFPVVDNTCLFNSKFGFTSLTCHPSSWIFSGFHFLFPLLWLDPDLPSKFCIRQLQDEVQIHDRSPEKQDNFVFNVATSQGRYLFYLALIMHV